MHKWYFSKLLLSPKVGNSTGFDIKCFHESYQWRRSLLPWLNYKRGSFPCEDSPFYLWDQFRDLSIVLFELPNQLTIIISNLAASNLLVLEYSGESLRAKDLDPSNSSLTFRFPIHLSIRAFPFYQDTLKFTFICFCSQLRHIF